VGTPFLSEIRIMSFGFAPKGWALCDGQLLPINQYQALFALLGTTYGGDGRVNFALPNLMGRTPISEGAGFTLGELAGEQTHTLTASEMPTHTHSVIPSTSAADVADPRAAYLTNSATTNFDAATSATQYMASNALTVTGGGGPHENRPPYLTVNICIALTGIFPSQS